MATVEYAPGAAIPRHIHHGDEFYYVLQGGTFDFADGTTRKVDVGGTAHFPRETSHGGVKVVSDQPITLMTIHIVDKGKPLLEEVK